MGITVSDIAQAAHRLRLARREALVSLSQADVVWSLALLAERWRDPFYPLRREAEALVEPFPFAMVQTSLNGLLDSLTVAELWRLIEKENVRDALGYPIVGHVIAGNTPLLAWTSVIRALLMRSGSLVKLPSGPAAAWGRLFYRSLLDISPPLAGCVEMMQWTGGTTEWDAALCRESDLVMAYGSDETMRRLHALCPAEKPFLEYSHRVSFGVISRGSDLAHAAHGLATDILLYDQGGCLSPQTIFIEGDVADAVDFGERLAGTLEETVKKYPLPKRNFGASAAVQEARTLARMCEGTQIWEDLEYRWTVIARSEQRFVPSPGFGVVSAQSLDSLNALPAALASVKGFMQGCVVANTTEMLSEILKELGVSYVCPPGQVQAPPLGWREDGRDVLRSLLPGAGHDDNLSW